MNNISAENPDRFTLPNLDIFWSRNESIEVLKVYLYLIAVQLETALAEFRTVEDVV